MRSALRSTAARLMGQLFLALIENGEVTIKLADLGKRRGLTCFKTKVIYLDHRLDGAGMVATLGHELLHLIRGPVDEHLAAEEEASVRAQTAALLVPSGRALGAINRAWTAAELAAYAAHRGVDRGTVRDAMNPPTRPILLQRVVVEGVA